MAIWVKPSGLEIELNEEKATELKAKSLGWSKKGESLSIDDMDKSQLEEFAKQFDVDLDKRKSVENLREEIKGLVNGNG